MRNFSNFDKEAYLQARAEEAALLPSLREFFKDRELAQSTGTFNRFDFISPHRKIELKTRRCLVDTYPDVMIGANKIAEAVKNHHNREYIFVFTYEDGTYYWRYDPAVFLECRIGGRCDRGIDERKDYYYIPKNLLIPLPILRRDDENVL